MDILSFLFENYDDVMLSEFDEKQLPKTYLPVKAVVQTINTLSAQFPFIEPVNMEISDKVGNPVFSGRTIFLPPVDPGTISWGGGAGHDLLHAMFNGLNNHFANFKNKNNPDETTKSKGNEKTNTARNKILPEIEEKINELDKSLEGKEGAPEHEEITSAIDFLGSVKQNTHQRWFEQSSDVDKKTLQKYVGPNLFPRIMKLSTQSKNYFEKPSKDVSDKGINVLTHLVEEDIENAFLNQIESSVRKGLPITKVNGKDIDMMVDKFFPGLGGTIEYVSKNAHGKAYDDLAMSRVKDAPRIREKTGLVKWNRNYKDVMKSFITTYNKAIARLNSIYKL